LVVNAAVSITLSEDAPRVLVLAPGEGLRDEYANCLKAAEANVSFGGRPVRIIVRTQAAFLRSGLQQPPHRVGGVVVLDPASDITAKLAGWGLPVLPVVFGDAPPIGGGGACRNASELANLAVDWLCERYDEIVDAPIRRVTAAVTNEPLRTFSLQAWEMLEVARQREIAKLVGMPAAAVGRALLDEVRYERLGTAQALGIATHLGVWDAVTGTMCRPAAPVRQFTTTELSAHRDASEDRSWSSATEALAFALALREKRRVRADVERDGFEVSLRDSRATFSTALRWISLMEANR
jgi:hypothetical protein